MLSPRHRCTRWASAKNRLESRDQPGKRSLWVRSKQYSTATHLLKSFADNAFTCLFCHHDKSVTVRLDRKEGLAQLVCRVCDQRYQSKVNRTPASAQLTHVSPSSQTSLNPLTFIRNGLTLQTLRKEMRNRSLGLLLRLRQIDQ
jgi:hypothetical protein